LWDVTHSRSEKEVDAFVAKIRVYDIAGQDDSGAWICREFPKIFWLRSVDMFQAISVRIARPFPPHVTGPNLETFTTEWVADNVRNHGPLGALYLERKWKYEGDTPAFLYLLPIGLNDPEQMTHGSWGGRFHDVKTRNPGSFSKRYAEAQKKFRDFEMYTEAPDRWRYKSKTYTSTYAGLFRWREAFQNDFATRMDWSLKTFNQANHPPKAILNGDKSLNILTVKAQAGEVVKLDASGSSDPDGDRLNVRWMYYPEPGTYGERHDLDAVEIGDSGAIETTVAVPVDAEKSDTIHIILKVTDDGDPPLTRYRRLIITVR
jgi:hypothetical protein